MNTRRKAAKAAASEEKSRRSNSFDDPPPQLEKVTTDTNRPNSALSDLDDPRSNENAPTISAGTLAEQAREIASGARVTDPDVHRLLDEYRTAEQRSLVIRELVQILIEREKVLDDALKELDDLIRLRDCRNAADHTLERRLTNATLHHDSAQFGEPSIPAEVNKVILRRKYMLEANAYLLMSAAGLMNTCRSHFG